MAAAAGLRWSIARGRDVDAFRREHLRRNDQRQFRHIACQQHDQLRLRYRQRLGQHQQQQHAGRNGGPGFISGSVTVELRPRFRRASRAPVPSGSIATLSVGGLTLGNGSQLNYQVNLPSSMDEIAITSSGTLTLPGSSPAVFNFYQPGSSSTPYTFGLGTYPLITYSVSRSEI